MAGFEAEPDEAAALAIAELAPIAEGWPADYLARYTAVSSRLALYQAVTGILAAERARCVAGMRGDGMTYQQIADAIGVTRGRAQQLVEAGARHAAAIIGAQSAGEAGVTVADLDLIAAQFRR